MHTEPTPDFIEELLPNQCFVFGSNLRGIHGAGAAKLAVERFGAVHGQGVGHWGQSFALPTKDWNIETLPLSNIASWVNMFLKHAQRNPTIEFLVTPIGCGLAGYHPPQIAPMFFRWPLPSNVRLPKSFEAHRPKIP